MASFQWIRIVIVGAIIFTVSVSFFLILHTNNIVSTNNNKLRLLSSSGIEPIYHNNFHLSLENYEQLLQKDSQLDNNWYHFDNAVVNEKYAESRTWERIGRNTEAALLGKKMSNLESFQQLSTQHIEPDVWSLNDKNDNSGEGCIAYSFRINGDDITFEQALYSRTKCSVFLFVCTTNRKQFLQFSKIKEDLLLTEADISIYTWCLGDGTKNSFSFYEIMILLNHDKVNIVNIDVPVSNYKALASTLYNFHSGNTNVWVEDSVSNNDINNNAIRKKIDLPDSILFNIHIPPPSTAEILPVHLLLNIMNEHLDYILTFKEYSSNVGCIELHFEKERTTTKTIHPYQMMLHSPPGVVSSILKKSGIWEAGITNRFQSVLSVECSSSSALSSPPYFIDIGTNIGFYSSLAASFNYHVLSIEAMNYNLHIFRETVALNTGFGKLINIQHIGISDKSGGYLCMSMPTGNAGNGQATFSAVKCDPNVIQVPVKTLDQITGYDKYNENAPLSSLMKQYQNTVGIKLDIEGFETRAILGGSRFIQQVKPCYIWFEHTPHAVIRSGKQPNDILDALNASGYVVYDIATPEKHIRSLNTDAFLEARHESCSYDYTC